MSTSNYNLNISAGPTRTLLCAANITGKSPILVVTLPVGWQPCHCLSFPKYKMFPCPVAPCPCSRNRAITLPTEQAEPTFKDVITIPCNTTGAQLSGGELAFLPSNNVGVAPHTLVSRVMPIALHHKHVTDIIAWVPPCNAVMLTCQGETMLRCCSSEH